MRHTRPFRGRPHTAHAGGYLLDHRADRLGHIQPPGQHDRRQQRVAHPAAPAPQPGHEDLPAAAPSPDIAPVARPERHRPATRRAARARHLHPAAGCHVSIDRKRAWPYHGHGRHRLGSLPATVAKRKRGGIPHVQRGRQNPGPPAVARQATSPKNTAGHPAGTIRKSSRQHPIPRGPDESAMRTPGFTLDRAPCADSLRLPACAMDWPDDEIGKDRSGSADRQAAGERQSSWRTSWATDRRLVSELDLASAHH